MEKTIVRSMGLGALVAATVISMALLLDNAFAVQQQDLSGTYSYVGKNPDGSSYDGEAEIVKHEDTYFIRWRLKENPPVYGIGILKGTELSVSLAVNPPMVAVYTVKGDKLDGQWATGAEPGKLFTETMTRAKEK